MATPPRRLRAAAVRAVIAAFVVLVAATACTPDWPMFLADNGRSAATTDPNLTTANVSNLALKWKSPTGGAIATSTSIVGTTAYVGSWDGNEYAINTTNGAVIWKAFLGIAQTPACVPPQIGITSSATVVNGVVYVGGGDNFWYALDAATGAVLWKVDTGPIPPAGARYNWSSPLIANGFAYIGIASVCDAPLVQGQLLKVDLTTHQVVAQHNFVPDGQVGGGIWTSPTLDAATNTIFVTTGTLNDYTQKESQAIEALDATTLATKSVWQLPFEAAVYDSDWGGTPTLMTDANGHQLVAAANKNGVIYAFNRNNLAAGPIWQHKIALGGDCPTCGDGTIASGIFHNNVLYFAGGQNGAANARGSGGSLTALDAGTGNVLWVRQTEQPIVGSPAYVNGMIAEVEGNMFEVLDAANGHLLYSYQLGGTSFGAVSIANSQFYVGANDGALYAFGLGPAPAVPPADPNCPAGFTCQDVGGATGATEATANGVLTVNTGGTGVGGPGLTGAADQFRFISKPVAGDQQTSVTVISQTPQEPISQAGIMVRQSTRPGSPLYAVLAYPASNDETPLLPSVNFYYRSCFGCALIEATKLWPTQRPISLMLQRKGNLFSAGVSTDGGATYTQIPGSSADVDLPTTSLTGLVAAATANPPARATENFSNLTVGAPVTTALNPQAPAHACPQTWNCQDIGNPSPRGDTTAAGTSFTLQGAGIGIGRGDAPSAALPWASDSFHFVSKALTGNQSISAQVVTQAGAPATAQEGLMMRQNGAATSPYYAALLNPGGATTISWRTYDGVEQRRTVPIPAATSGVYLKLVRFQDASVTPAVTYFATQTSPDGVNWTSVLGSTVAIDMGAGNYLAGLAATSTALRATVPVVFNAVTFGAVAAPPPGVCAPGFTCTDIGNEIQPGNQVFLPGANGALPTWEVAASGSDIWGNFDNFRFISEPFPPANSANGDGTFSARVVAQTNPGGDWMKSGVMFRSSATDPEAPYYAAFITPAHGVVIQWRPTEGALTNSAQGPAAATTPIWLLISRYTDTAHAKVLYSASTSADGKNFTYVPGSEVALNLPGPLVAGIASDSYNAAMRSNITFDNVASLGGSQPPPFVCPAAWSCDDIGGPLPPGTDSLANGTWAEVGGGGDIWDVADSFHLVSQPLTGDGMVTAHVTAQQATDPWAKAGPMMRSTTDPGSPYYAVFVTPGHGIAVQWRPTAGGLTNQVVVPGAVPAYLAVGRSTANGQTSYTAYTSTDGTNWAAVPGSTQVLKLAQPLLAGFGITSHDQGVGSAVSLDHVAVTAGQTPQTCPATWSCTDVGGPLPAGTDSLANGIWTSVGGGGDIWGTADAFHLVTQPLTGDGMVTTHVTAQQATDPWAKAGPMMRSTTDPGSPYYSAFITPGHGIDIQWRPTAAGVTNQLLVPGAVPVYLAVGRTTTNGQTSYTAYTSADGITWTAVPGSTQVLNLAQPLLAGFGITSHDQGVGSAVTLDRVAVMPGTPTG